MTTSSLYKNIEKRKGEKVKEQKKLTIGNMCSTQAKMSCSYRFLASILLCTIIFGKFLHWFSYEGTCKKIYLAVLWIGDKFFDADLENGICISLKSASVNKGDLKEVIKDDKLYGC